MNVETLVYKRAIVMLSNESLSWIGDPDVDVMSEDGQMVMW